MKRKTTCMAIFILLMAITKGIAQDKFFTKSGRISFYSKSPLEDIEAVHKSVTCVLDTKTGNLQFSVLMKGFEFKKAKMQEDFNEDYVESDKYPKSEFKGQVANNSEINYAKDGVYPAKVKGKLSIHGVTKDVESEGKIAVKEGKIEATSDFNIELSDYKISIPSVVKEKVAKNIKISIDCLLNSFKG